MNENCTSGDNEKERFIVPKLNVLQQNGVHGMSVQAASIMLGKATLTRGDASCNLIVGSCD